MLLPATFSLPPNLSLIMLAGIYYGAQYGGSTTTILINTLGEASSVVTSLDGHQMARRGKGGVALATAAIGSFVGGTIATAVIVAVAPMLANFAIGFGPVEYFSLMLFGLVCAVALASGSILNAVAMVIVGLILGLVGTDTTYGVHRMTFGFPQLYEGLDLIAVAMGLFGIAEVIRIVENRHGSGVEFAQTGSLLPDPEERRRMRNPILRGSFLGSLLGVLPGGGALIASFVSYAIERKISKHPDRFGSGMIEGVAGPETANNAAAQTSFIPTLTLGIPTNAVMAMMIGAMMIQGIAPGPSVMTNYPQLFWGLIVSMWIGNLMLLVLNLPLISLWVRLLAVPARLLAPLIIVFSSIGAYSLQSSGLNVIVMLVAGLLGYLLSRMNCEPAPLVLGFLLGPMMEENLQRAMLLSGGDWSVFFTSEISITLLVVSVILVIATVVPAIAVRRSVLADN